MSTGSRLAPLACGVEPCKSIGTCRSPLPSREISHSELSADLTSNIVRRSFRPSGDQWGCQPLPGRLARSFDPVPSPLARNNSLLRTYASESPSGDQAASQAMTLPSGCAAPAGMGTNQRGDASAGSTVPDTSSSWRVLEMSSKVGRLKGTAICAVSPPEAETSLIVDASAVPSVK